jgi:Tfp pilus assembly protein PilV
VTRPHPRSGLSVVEVLVALTITAIGLLGIAGSSALALRSSLATTRQHRAEQQAVSRLAQLTAAGCALAKSGAATDTLRQLHEAWIVSPAIGGSAIVTDSVSWLEERGRKSLTLFSTIQC